MMQLWTPTDWAEETRLRIDYLSWQIEHNELPCLRLTLIDLGLLNFRCPEQIMRLYQETGCFIHDSGYEEGRPSYEPLAFYEPLTFEEWRALHENSRFYGL